MTLSKYGVCYSLPESPYRAEVMGFVFHFSTPNHQRKFMESARVRCEWLSDSLTRRFHYAVGADILALFQLYEQVESRGFYVVSDDGTVYRSVSDCSFEVRMNAVQQGHRQVRTDQTTEEEACERG